MFNIVFVVPLGSAFFGTNNTVFRWLISFAFAPPDFAFFDVSFASRAFHD